MCSELVSTAYRTVSMTVFWALSLKNEIVICPFHAAHSGLNVTSSWPVVV